EEKLDRPLRDEQWIGDLELPPNINRPESSDRRQLEPQSQVPQIVDRQGPIDTEVAPKVKLQELHEQIEEKQHQIEEIARPYRKFTDEVRDLTTRLNESR